MALRGRCMGTEVGFGGENKSVIFTEHERKQRDGNDKCVYEI